MPRPDPSTYQTCMVRPDDFDAFWDDLLDQAGRIPLNATVERLALRSTPEVDVYEVHYDSLDGIPIAGWYCLPTERPDPLPTILHVPGYNSDPSIPKASAKSGYAAFFAAPRGKLRSNAQFNPGYPGLLTHNIVDRNTYAYRGFYIDAVRAVDFLLTRDEIDSAHIGVTGSSQGGALTLIVAALHPKIRAAAAGAPYLCGFMDAIQLTHTYPYQEIRDYLRLYPNREPAVRDTLAYFDGIHFGPRITCPIIVNIGLQDNICPPETGYATFETIASTDKTLYPYDGCGHDAGRSTHGAIIDTFLEKHLKS
ncbi:MAG: acetylxylan esterase [bacterium]|nr:acetylxylan esterase [bacterium]